MAKKLLDPSFERLLQRGPGALTDTEIVSLLLGNQGSQIASLEHARIFLWHPSGVRTILGEAYRGWRRGRRNPRLPAGTLRVLGAHLQ